uniref:PhoD-like phosphatase metallophosphatase domain-containing protein n=1 Tax=Leptocylindrus danicus TaxID=163516 RepID=A0A7S2L2G1_9STRA
MPTSTSTLLGSPDEHHSRQVTTLAFGSCHNRRLLEKYHAETGDTKSIWKSVAEQRPDAWLWTGDAVYLPKRKGVGSVQSLVDEYNEMLYIRNEQTASEPLTLQYGEVVKYVVPLGAFGTWDDHDYGANDRGNDMPQREPRRDAFLDFLDVPQDSPRRHREGVYNSITFGEGDKKVKVIFLDTRWHRDSHLIPSLASSKIPLGSVLACLTRWFSAAQLPERQKDYDGTVLGEEQWQWLERQVEDSDASVNVIVSSIQVFTTNPAVESWGHFEKERDRFVRTIQDLPGLVILSGDVHHAELLGAGPILEVTSSGMTHSCTGPFYGVLCEHILDSFNTHRKQSDFPSGSNGYYTDKNFGTLKIDWHSKTPTFTVNVHDHSGKIVLSTVRALSNSSKLSEMEIQRIPKLAEDHNIPTFQIATTISLVASLLLIVLMIWMRRALQVRLLYTAKRKYT